MVERFFTNQTSPLLLVRDLTLLSIALYTVLNATRDARPGEGGLGLSVDGDVPPRDTFWTQKSGQRIAKLEIKNPGIFNAIELIYLFFVDIVRSKSIASN